MGKANTKKNIFSLTTDQKKLLKKYAVYTNNWESVLISEKKDIMTLPVPKNFFELRITSGSTGDPLYVFYSKKSVQAFLHRTCTSLKKSGVSKKDILLNLFAYGNYVPGSMYEKACQILEVPVLPLGAPNTYPKEKIIDCICKIKPTVWCSVPSYALNLLNILKSTGSTYKPKKIIVAGEKLLDVYIDKFKEYGVQISNHLGLTECPAIGVSVSNNPRRIHVIQDGIFVESKKTSEGNHLIVTDLYNDVTPIVRYDTKDIIEDIVLGKDGRIKEFTLVGRDDDFIKLQGILISKTKIINSLVEFTEKFFINIKIKDDRDLVEVMIDSSLSHKISEIEEKLNFILCKKNIVFLENLEVPKTISNKIKYINDFRR